MITSPSNPTGTTIAFDTLKSVCDLTKERGAWRIVDETYLDLADREPDGSDVKSVLACDRNAHRMFQLLQVLRHEPAGDWAGWGRA